MHWWPFRLHHAHQVEMRHADHAIERNEENLQNIEQKVDRFEREDFDRIRHRFFLLLKDSLNDDNG